MCLPWRWYNTDAFKLMTHKLLGKFSGLSNRSQSCNSFSDGFWSSFSVLIWKNCTSGWSDGKGIKCRREESCKSSEYQSKKMVHDWPPLHPQHNFPVKSTSTSSTYNQQLREEHFQWLPRASTNVKETKLSWSSRLGQGSTPKNTVRMTTYRKRSHGSVESFTRS